MKVIVVLFFLSFAACGQVGVEVGGRVVGTSSTLDFESGSGIMEACRNENSRIVCQPSYNSAVIATHDTVHSNENYCFSTNGTAQYTCRLPYRAIASYQAGMTFVLVADTPCVSSCSLDIDSAGVVSIKGPDGLSDAPGGVNPGEPQWVFYDGRVFRLMGSLGPRRAEASALPRERDSIARRFISSLDIMIYAPTFTLETTAGDMHKVTTSNAIGNATIDAATSGLAGQHMWLIIVNDQFRAKTVSFGKNFKSAGPLTGSPGKSATLQFISDGTAWYEVARATNL
jgi:hypothetical protein